MRGVGKLLLAFVAVALLATGLTACGSDSSSDSTQSSASATGSESPSTSASENGDSPAAEKGSASFHTPGGDNSVQNFGDEADAAEFEAASTALTGYAAARAKDDWKKECVYLAVAAVEPLEELVARSPKTTAKGCAATLEAISAGIPISVRANTMTGGIASLRVEGERGFALYHGAKGVNYFVPMLKEDGEWKVGALAPTEFP